MTPYEAYIDYLALKRHFTTESYDYHKYNGKVVAKKDSFEKRKDKFFFEKIARHKDPHNLILSVILNKSNAWVRDISSDEGYKQYNEWLKKTQAITRTIENDLSQFHDEFDSNFKIEDNQHPFILKLFLSEKITLETLVILTNMVGCLSYWDKHMSYDPVWNEVYLKIKKYRGFLHYDKEKIRKICLDKFSL